MIEVEFFTDIFATFIGAFFAFFFSFGLYKYQKKQNNTVYLKYSVARFAKMAGGLYVLKEQQTAPRLLEIENFENSLDEMFLEIDEISYVSKKLLSAGYNASVDIEKLSFLAQHDPNVIMLLQDASNAFERVGAMIDECNIYSERLIQNPNSRDLAMILECNRALATYVNDAIYLTELVTNTLIKACKLYYDDKNVKGFEVFEKFKKLKPQPLESYERQEWFPEQKSYFDYL